MRLGSFKIDLNRKTIIISLIVLVTLAAVSISLMLIRRNEKDVANNNNVPIATSPRYASPTPNNVSPTPNNEVVVNNAKEFADALKPDVLVKLMPGDYDLNKLAETFSNEYFKDGKITGIKNVTIVGSGDTTLDFITYNTYLPVLNIDNCENIVIRNLNMGHDPKIGNDVCVGYVVLASNSKNITFDGCILFGCGLRGLNLNAVDGLEFKNSTIKECSSQTMSLSNSRNLKFEDSKFVNNGEGVSTLSCQNIKISNCSFVGDGYTPNIVDSDFSVYLSAEGTLFSDLGGYASRYFESYDDGISNVSLEKVWFSNKLFYDENLKIYNNFKEAMGDTLKAVNIHDVGEGKQKEEALWEVILKLDKEEKTISKVDISKNIKKLSGKINEIKDSSPKQYIFKLLSKDNNCVIEITFNKSNLVNFLMDKKRNDFEGFSESSIKSSLVPPSKIFGMDVDYLSGAEALGILEKLVDVKREVNDPDYVNGGDFQKFNYKGTQGYGGECCHYIDLEQKLPLLGDFIHYSKIGTFKVSCSSGTVYYISGEEAEQKLEKISEDIKQAVIDYAKSDVNTSGRFDEDKSVFILLDIGKDKKAVDVELFNNEGVCGTKRYYLMKKEKY
ncbi:right-handed parallel beta-helix repeat-containing protein [Acetivibrio cellulolyticus]|uniref:right-handed parallel beta-helix repeat-containing protein n=1 Tax=Acetivibrio cellulolyticus TaxID=35830 RepID=UPI0001E30196|nr:right-handed parallel beta-helix repeat-containing protein [Acetivibrio cellulolyticus]